MGVFRSKGSLAYVEEFEDEVLGLRRDKLGEFDIAGNDAMVGVHDVVIVERGLACQHLVEQHAARPPAFGEKRMGVCVGGGG